MGLQLAGRVADETAISTCRTVSDRKPDVAGPPLDAADHRHVKGPLGGEWRNLFSGYGDVSAPPAVRPLGQLRECRAGWTEVGSRSSAALWPCNIWKNRYNELRFLGTVHSRARDLKMHL